jgi:hypothetical protein
MQQYFARPFQLPWLSCSVLALSLLIAAMIRGNQNGSEPANATSAKDNSSVLIVHARTNR